MDITYIMLMISLACSLEVGFVDAGSSPQFDVLSFGAVGDGVADDTQAFTKAWNATCAATTGPPTMVVPGGKTYLVMPTTFKGPCNLRKVYIRIEGKVVAPDPSKWTGYDRAVWLQFYSVTGLTIVGYGEINGRGQNWWNQLCKYDPKPGCTFEAAPTGVKFVDCSGLSVRDVHSVDSPMFHFVVLDSRRVGFSGINITAPWDSPNTDGIHLQNSRHVQIESSVIQTGDDCISIGNYVSDVNIEGIVCGPGHGIRFVYKANTNLDNFPGSVIGSLGKDGTEASVEQVNIKNSNFSDTQNGVRIKTWQGGKGFARGISFQDCNFNNVHNPIIIDQYYCDSPNKCESQANAVQISNVRYINLHGTSKSVNAVSLNCSQSVPCTSLELDTVNLVGADPSIDTKAVCVNAHGQTKGLIQPAVTCLG